MEPEARAILEVFGERGLGSTEFIHFTDFGEAIVWEDGFVDNKRTRDALTQLIEGGYVVELMAGLELTQKGYDWLKANGLVQSANSQVLGYRIAQHAIANLKVAILQTLTSCPPNGLSNAEIGRSLGIYMGHVGHEGHISRTLLAVMESEGVVMQSADTKRWMLRKPADDRKA
jgi:hypothetical protein